jgi:hypothetical protein
MSRHDHNPREGQLVWSSPPRAEHAMAAPLFKREDRDEKARQPTRSSVGINKNPEQHTYNPNRSLVACFPCFVISDVSPSGYTADHSNPQSKQAQEGCKVGTVFVKTKMKDLRPSGLKPEAPPPHCNAVAPTV